MSRDIHEQAAREFGTYAAVRDTPLFRVRARVDRTHLAEVQLLLRGTSGSERLVPSVVLPIEPADPAEVFRRPVACLGLARIGRGCSLPRFTSTTRRRQRNHGLERREEAGARRFRDADNL